MRIIAIRYRKAEAPSADGLGEGDLGKAQKHLADLAKAQRPVAAETRSFSAPRRRLGRRTAIERERLRIGRDQLSHAARAHHHRLGRFLLRLRLTAKTLRNWPLFFSLLILVLASGWRFAFRPPDGSFWDVVAGVFFGAALIGAVAIVWSDIVRNPYAARRIRRHIVEHPESILPTTSPLRQAELVARDERMPIVPRDDLYDEILPGILDRRRRDVQMVVGEPGSGKTTALVDLGGRLARMGFVPVLLPIWEKLPDDLIGAAEERFKRHAERFVGSNARLEELWRWLRLQERLVVAIDDVDRMAPDGERGFMLRRALEELAGANLPAVVTTRPAGIPAGLAASAIELGELDPEAAVDHVLRVARAEPGSLAAQSPTAEVRASVARWVREGRFAEVPFYLELLARLAAVRGVQELPPAEPPPGERVRLGHICRKADGRCEWNPLWVRFLLLEHFYNEVVAGRVHRWLAIERREREDCLEALSEAALATLGAAGIGAREGVRDGGGDGSTDGLRTEIEEFLKSDDRARFAGAMRRTISAHEVVDAGERLRVLDRDPDGKLHFHHRIMQAYLAARCLAARPREVFDAAPAGWPEDPDAPVDWIGILLDASYPDRLAAHTTLTFAALRAETEEQAARNEESPEVVGRVLERLVAQAASLLPRQGRGEDTEQDDHRLDPRRPYHPEGEGRRKDPDDALAKLATAAEIARVTESRLAPPSGIGEEDPQSARIVELARAAHGATMWTKLHAIPCIAALDSEKSWICIWEFARDPDQEVRRTASEAIESDALAAYRSLYRQIERLLHCAALRSDRGLSLESGETDPVTGSRDGGALAWNPDNDPQALQALGWILPAMVSGLRENLPDTADVRGPRQALEDFVRLAFEGDHPELEASLAQGFKRDAMYHAIDPGRRGGAGLVAGPRRLVTDLCFDRAEYWYARLVLHQALALYVIAGAKPQDAYELYEHLVPERGEPHPFVFHTARLVERAVRRHALGSERWQSLIWADEGVAVSRRPTEMSRSTSQLVADVTLLLNLRERAPEDRKAHFPRMQELPYCLHGSADRQEILGAGCPSGCRYGFCPLRQPPPDEPNGQRTVSRAFCRDQYERAGHRPRWQERMGRGALREFWRQMERRART